MTASSAFEAHQPIEQQSDGLKNSGLSNISLDLLKEAGLSSAQKGASNVSELVFSPIERVTNAASEHNRKPVNPFIPPIPTEGPIPPMSRVEESTLALAPLDGKPVLRPRPGSQHPTGDSISMKDEKESKVAAVAPLDGKPVLRPRPGSQHPSGDSVSVQDGKVKQATWRPEDKDPKPPIA